MTGTLLLGAGIVISFGALVWILTDIPSIWHFGKPEDAPPGARQIHNEGEGEW